MAINKNHEFEDLDGVKCAIVEKNAPQQRVDFLKNLLEFNGYKVMVIASPPAKTTAAPAADAVENSPVITAPATTFTIGVTDVMFNPTNAIFGRMLHTADGHIVTLAYWQQKEDVSEDGVPYFEDLHR